ncbi:MAG: glycosyltransferase family 9 protein [Bacteroidetes bacterium]|nr:glycosyltransferase family 9 protein [Bacteroidota bacterium]
MKILLIRFSSIGDIVLTTPVVRCLKLQMPEAEIHYLTKRAFKPILIANPYIDQLHFLDDNLDEIIPELQTEHFDLVIDLHKNIRSLKVKRALNVPAKSFNKKNVEKWLLVNFKINWMPEQSIVARYMATVSTLGIVNDGKGLDYFIPPETKLTNNDVPMSHWAGYVACVIGGSYQTKKLPVAKWKELINKVPFPVMLIGGPEDKADGREIAEMDAVKIYNSCGKFNLNESAWLIEKSKVVVSNDTGMMHIAAAFKKPIISLWGNTSPEMGMFPYYGSNDWKTHPSPLSLLMNNQDLYCHPCSKLGYAKCPKKHFRCMNELDMEKAANAVKKYWLIPNGQTP